MQLKAIYFDTGGTVLDWHGGLVRAFDRIGRLRGVERDWHVPVNDWRRRAMKRIAGQIGPSFNMDDVHLDTLADVLQTHQLDAFTPDDRQALWRTWHELEAWPDFAAAQRSMGTQLPVLSFTMLPTAMVVDVSRRNGLIWDAIISCEMIGHYKPHAQAYATAASWMNLKPGEILMVACHNFDLNAAHAAGFQTAFVRRPDEWGPEGPPEPHPNMAYDFEVDGFHELAGRVVGPSEQA